MPTVNHGGAVLNEEIWRAWVQKGRQRERPAARRVKIISAVLAALAALSGGLYVFTAG